MKKQDQKIINDLEQAPEEKVLEALKLAEEKGNDNLIPVIISLALSHKSEEVVRASMELLRSVKSKALIPSLIDAIDNAKKSSDKRKLVSLCWENAQKCDDYFKYFVNLAITEPFEVSLEAITVIEEMEGKVDANDLEKSIADTEKAIKEQPEKATLLAGLAVKLKEFKA